MDEYIKEWEDLIDAVDKTSLPIRFVNRISFESTSGSKAKFKKTINVEDLFNSGYDEDEIQEIINNTLLEFPGHEGEAEFDLDTLSISFAVQDHTNEILKKLK